MQDPPRQAAEALFFLSNRHLADHDFAAAEQCLRQALEMAPDFAEALTNLGFLLDQRGDVRAAEDAYRRAQSAGADSYELHLNLGALLATQKRFEEAELAYAEALRRQPDASAVWSNLGALYLGLKQEQVAESCLRRALELDPANPKARFNVSYLCLRQGRFEEGWQCLESRDWYAPLAAHFTMPRWAGEPLGAKSLIIGYEAGHGDVIQFARYVPVLRARGAERITLVCHPALKALMGTLEGIASVMGFDETIPRDGWDYWTPLMSIPHHLQTRADTIPAHIPYLRAEPERVHRWAPLLPQGTLRVGLVWKGNPLFENDSERSLPSVLTLAPLWDVSGACFVSLQKGAGEEDLPQLGPEFPIVDLGTRMENFADAAAIIVGLDLVICVDTAVAHLAGALGKPCWVLLPFFMTDWRWRSDGAESAWYPRNMRLFRQTQRGVWSDVIDEVADVLRAMALGR